MFRIADAALASNARRIFRRYLEAQVAAGSDLDGAELVFGELLGNVARHAPGSVDVRLRWNGRTGILEISDRGAGYSIDDVHLPPDDVESTRGLFIISVFAHDLRVRRDEGVTTTTVTLPIQRRLPDPPRRAPAA